MSALIPQELEDTNSKYQKSIQEVRPTVHRWLNKLERYFKLMRYSADIWVDVIATCITHPAKVWLDKSLRDIQLGRCNPWADWAVFRHDIGASFTPMLEAKHARRSLLDIRQSAVPYPDVQSTSNESGGGAFVVHART